MPRIRLSLVVKATERTTGKDGVLINAYKEVSKTGKEFVVKRSGLEEGFALSGTGQGVHTRELTYVVVDGVLNDVITPATYTLASDTLPYEFLDLPDAVGEDGFLLKSTASLYHFTE